MQTLIEVAHEVGLNVMENASLPESMTGLFVRTPGIDPVAGLSKNIYGCPKLEKVALATCIGAHIVIADDDLYIPTYYDDYKKKRLTANRAEYRRRRKAVEIAISSEELLVAIASGIEDVWDFAELFGVDEEFMAFRLAVWEKSGR